MSDNMTVFQKAKISFTVDEIKRMTDRNRFSFDNIVQRSFVWEKSRMSELIATIIEGYPIPSIFARRIDGSVYDILDGKQRLTAIYKFMTDDFDLTGIDPVCYEKSDGEVVTEDLSGMCYSNLPNDVQRIIERYQIDFIYFDGITDKQVSILFRKLNNGKPLSAKDKNIANCRDILKVRSIGEHKLFKKILSEKALANRNQIPIVVKTWVMMISNVNDVSFESKVFNQTMRDADITASQEAEIAKVYDKYLSVINMLENAGNKFAAKKLSSEVNMISLVPFFYESVRLDIADNLMYDFVSEFFCEKSFSESYKEACMSGSAKASQIKKRNDLLTEAWNKFFSVE